MAKGRRHRRSKCPKPPHPQTEEKHDKAKKSPETPPKPARKHQTSHVKIDLKDSSTLTCRCSQHNVSVQTPRGTKWRRSASSKMAAAASSLASYASSLADIRFAPHVVSAVSVTTQPRQQQTHSDDVSSIHLEFVSASSLAVRDTRIRSACSLRRIYAAPRSSSSISAATTVAVSKPSLASRTSSACICKWRKFRLPAGVERTRVVKAQRRSSRKTREEQRGRVAKSFTPQKLVLLKTRNVLSMSAMSGRRNVVVAAGKSGNCTASASGGGGWGFLHVVKTIHDKCAQRIIQRFVEVCTWLGLHFTGLTVSCKSTAILSLSNFRKNTKNTGIQLADSTIEKMSELENEMAALKQQLLENQSLSKDVQDLRVELAEVKNLLRIFAVSHHNGCHKLSPSTSAPPPPPPPPPMPTLRNIAPPPPPPMPARGLAPPPPPPPPPPMPLLSLATSNKLKIDRSRNETRKSDDGSARPVISVDEILKVKLKKPSDRLSPIKSPRAPAAVSAQPMVSTDMLRQVKLKPAARNQPSPPGGCGPSSTSLRPNIRLATARSAI